MRISTRSGPNSAIRGARRDALDGSGASRVPRRASVRMLSLTLGFARSVCWSVAIFEQLDPCCLLSRGWQIYQFFFRLADVECRQEDALFGASNLLFEGLVELGRRLQHSNLGAVNPERRRYPVEIIDKGGERADVGYCWALRCSCGRCRSSPTLCACNATARPRYRCSELASASRNTPDQHRHKPVEIRIKSATSLTTFKFLAMQLLGIAS